MGYAAVALEGMAPVVAGFLPHFKRSQRQLLQEQTSDCSAVKTGFFQQLIDHGNPGLGTFSQMYFWTDEYWGGPGSPVVLSTPGEATTINGTQSLLTKNWNIGAFAQEIKGAAILLEHRYFGNSTPFANQTTENLQYMTVKNAIADLTYFARNVELPFDTNHSSNAPQAPWVLTGGSYSGALVRSLAAIIY